MVRVMCLVREKTGLGARAWGVLLFVWGALKREVPRNEGETGKAPNPTGQPASRTLGDTSVPTELSRGGHCPLSSSTWSLPPPSHPPWQPQGPQASREMLMAPAPSGITSVSLVSPGVDSPSH